MFGEFLCPWKSTGNASVRTLTQVQVQRQRRSRAQFNGPKETSVPLFNVGLLCAVQPHRHRLNDTWFVLLFRVSLLTGVWDV